MDLKKIRDAVILFLEGIGEDPKREGLIETPDRVARMCDEIFDGMRKSPQEFLLKQFNVDNNEMVIVKNIEFYSICEHHLLPFFGNIHIAYVPNGKVVGLSKLARAVDVYAHRLQIQEQLTNQIADSIEKNIKPKGVSVIVEAKHMCMTMRGIKKSGSETATYTRRGCFVNDFEKQKMFIDAVKL